jgi:hypothetical protein
MKSSTVSADLSSANRLHGSYRFATVGSKLLDLCGLTLRASASIAPDHVYVASKSVPTYNENAR